MTFFYQKYVELCAKKNMSLSAVAKEIGLSNAAATGWKNGKMPSEVTLEKLSKFFGVTVDYLLTGAKTEKAPTSEGERKINDDDIKFALFGGNSEITDEMYEEVKAFAKFVQKREQEKRG